MPKTRKHKSDARKRASLLSQWDISIRGNYYATHEPATIIVHDANGAVHIYACHS